MAAKLPPWMRKLLTPKTRAELERFSAHLGTPRWDKPLGCGHYGCAFRVSDTHVLKITRDPTEGPMQAFIGKRQDEGVYGFDGFALVDKIGQGPSFVLRGKTWPIYFILREDVLPLFGAEGTGLTESFVEKIYPRATRRSVFTAAAYLSMYQRLARALEQVKSLKVSSTRTGYRSFATAGVWNAIGITGGSDSIAFATVPISKQRAIDEIEGALTYILNGPLSDTFPYLAEAMGAMADALRPMMDVHPGNIGIRIHALQGDDSALGAVVIFDPGHTPTEGSTAPRRSIERLE